MGATGIEPVTSSASGKRSPAELSARGGTVTVVRWPPEGDTASRGFEATTGIEPV